MKTKRFISFIAIMLVTLSCSESFFDRYPMDSLTEGAFYSTKEEIEFGVNDAYLSLRSAYDNYLKVGDLASDNAFNSKFNNNLDNISMNESNMVSTNTVATSLWSGSYQVISRSNIVLSKMTKVPLTETVADRFEGECKFLRALMYFNLVRIFGSVPLVLTDITSTTEAFAVGQETVDNVYDQIITDLTDAMALLPQSYTVNADKGRATSLAAMTLLGKVYLTLDRYQDAYDILEDVKLAGVHSLLQNYFDVFDASKPNNAEIIFSVQYGRGYSPSMANPFMGRHFPNEQIGSAPYLKSGSGEYLMTTSIIREIEDNDERWIYVDSLKSVTWSPRYLYFSKKYTDLGQTTVSDSGSDLVILRYADVLLMLAEAKAELDLPSEALPFLEEVRERSELTTDPTVASSKQSMLMAIEHERRIEFFSEGHRWFDLVRTERLQTVMNGHFADGAKYPAEETGFNVDAPTTFNVVESFELLFPIPYYQIQLNPDKLKQNLGY